MVHSTVEPRDEDLHTSWRHELHAVVLAALIGILLGYLGWTLPRPGGSLIFPTLIVAATGASTVAVSVAFAIWRPRRLRLVTLAPLLTVFTVIAAVWTFQFSLRASMAWDASATPRAQAVLFGLNHGNENETVPPHPCSYIATGSIGPLVAPYRQCAISTSEGHFVTFTAAGSMPSRGISYTDRGPETFLEECYKHLVGHWWMFVGADLSNPASPCPFGYQFHGGP